MSRPPDECKANIHAPTVPEKQYLSFRSPASHQHCLCGPFGARQAAYSGVGGVGGLYMM